MARGVKGAFGADINDPLVWFAFCALFFIGLADWRRFFSIRTVDLLVLLSFTVSLAFFNRGEVFRAMPLVYPPLALPDRTAPLDHLEAQADRDGAAGLAGVAARRRDRSRGRLPRRAEHRGLEHDRRRLRERDRCAADRRAGRVAVRAHADRHGQGVRPRRRERLRARADPDERALRVGERPRRHVRPGHLPRLRPRVPRSSAGAGTGTTSRPRTSRRSCSTCSRSSGSRSSADASGGNRLAATLAFAWAAYPFTQYVSNSNSNDAVMPVILIWGFWLLSSAPSRGAFIALAGWAKFSGFLLVPLWASYPRGTGKDAGKRLLLFELGFLAATLAVAWILFLEPDPVTPRASSGIAPSAGSCRVRRRSRSGTGTSTTTRISRSSRAS